MDVYNALSQELVEDMPIANDANGTDGQFDNPRSNFRPDVRARFHAWALSQKSWLQVFVDFRVKQTLLDHIMKLLSGNYTDVTLKRNLQKYTGLNPVIYICCGGHMLFK